MSVGQEELVALQGAIRNLEIALAHSVETEAAVEYAKKIDKEADAQIVAAKREHALTASEYRRAILGGHDLPGYEFDPKEWDAAMTKRS